MRAVGSLQWHISAIGPLRDRIKCGQPRRFQGGGLRCREQHREPERERSESGQLPGDNGGRKVSNGCMRSLNEADFQTALIIEPSLAKRLPLRLLLLESGVKSVLEAEAASEAITLMRQELVNVVLTPWQTPELSGTPLLRAFRNCGRNRNVPVVLLDEGLAQTTIVAAVKAGIAARLSLPGSVARMRAIFRSISESRTPTPASPGPA